MKQAALFVYVWPEPRSSAAGVRTVEICRHLQELGFEVTAFSPCKENAASEELRSLGILTQACPANESWVQEKLSALAPELVIYDRFVMEEQLGWRARATWPDALHVVDTQDIHAVRRARERIVRQGGDVMDLSGADFTTDLDRELASLYRADACFVVSSWEKEWLAAQGYPAERIFWLPFGAAPEETIAPFAERAGFCFLGNFRHPPNLDAVEYMAKEIWPAIRERLPKSKLYLYGAYPPAVVSQLHGKKGVEVPGSVRLHREALQKHRVLLAPLRFGAGIKGKVLEAWACGTAVVGSPVAMEGLNYPAFGENFVAEAIRLHEEEEAFLLAQNAGFQALAPFAPALLKEKLREFLEVGFARRAPWRNHAVGRMLRHSLHNSTKYFSQWIEAKNKGKA